MLPGGRPGRPATTGGMAPNAGPLGAPRVMPARGGALRTAVAAAPTASAPAQANPAPNLQAMVQAEEEHAAAAHAALVAAPVAVPQAAVQAPAVPARSAAGGFRGLFGLVTGAAQNGMRRTLTEPAPAPVAPRLDQPSSQRPAEVPQGQVDFEIPTFLRRQSN
jgi:cell division protein FtsZ